MTQHLLEILLHADAQAVRAREDFRMGMEHPQPRENAARILHEERCNKRQRCHILPRLDPIISSARYVCATVNRAACALRRTSASTRCRPSAHDVTMRQGSAVTARP